MSSAASQQPWGMLAVCEWCIGHVGDFAEKKSLTSGIPWGCSEYRGSLIYRFSLYKFSVLKRRKIRKKVLSQAYFSHANPKVMNEIFAKFGTCLMDQM